jgi:hypothetical protein
MVATALMRTLDGWPKGHWKLQQDIERLTFMGSDLERNSMIR